MALQHTRSLSQRAPGLLGACIYPENQTVRANQRPQREASSYPFGLARSVETDGRADLANQGPCKLLETWGDTYPWVSVAAGLQGNLTFGGDPIAGLAAPESLLRESEEGKKGTASTDTRRLCICLSPASVALDFTRRSPQAWRVAD